MNKSKNLQALRSKEADVFTASLPPVISEDIWGEQTKERDEMKKYRVVTRDGFIFNHYSNLKDARAAANQQSRQLQETMVIKKFDNFDGVYCELETVHNF